MTEQKRIMQAWNELKNNINTKGVNTLHKAIEANFIPAIIEQAKYSIYTADIVDGLYYNGQAVIDEYGNQELSRNELLEIRDEIQKVLKSRKLYSFQLVPNNEESLILLLDNEIHTVFSLEQSENEIIESIELIVNDFFKRTSGYITLK